MLTTFTLLNLENRIHQTEGGLFDFNATLPLMALQFLLLMLILNNIFYKPVTNILDERDQYIRNSLTAASAALLKADKLTQTYENQLAESRKKAQEIIRVAQQEAQKIVSVSIKEAQQEAEELVYEASVQLNIQKDQALKTLESQVDILSNQIQAKLLSEELL
uniref:ATP synthase CFO B' chain subunit II n=1 Tax=Sporolithon durum TaxID=48970 RepID=A0A141SCU0_9FLOR|nr:ATP synthase CFO B' chain subunit II [Sporolithon durum]AMK96108.1 ATP synthase CFO B' chain subunit II [Sporolithon durum]